MRFALLGQRRFVFSSAERSSPDGTFMLAAVAAGDYDVELGMTSPGGGDDLYVGAIRRGDEDVLAKGLSINGPSSGPIQIILKPNGGAVYFFTHN